MTKKIAVKMQKWIKDQFIAGDFIDDCGEPNLTEAAECAIIEFDIDTSDYDDGGAPEWPFECAYNAAIDAGVMEGRKVTVLI